MKLWTGIDIQYEFTCTFAKHDGVNKSSYDSSIKALNNKIMIRLVIGFRSVSDHSTIGHRSVK